MDQPNNTPSPPRPRVSLAARNAQRETAENLLLSNTGVPPLTVAPPTVSIVDPDATQPISSIPSSHHSELGSQNSSNQSSGNEEKIPPILVANDEAYIKLLEEEEALLQRPIDQPSDREKRMKDLLELMKKFSELATTVFSTLKKKDSLPKKLFEEYAFKYNKKTISICEIIIDYLEKRRDPKQSAQDFLGDDNNRLSFSSDAEIPLDETIKIFEYQYANLNLKLRGVSEYPQNEDQVKAAYYELRAIRKELLCVLRSAENKLELTLNDSGKPADEAIKEVKDLSEDELKELSKTSESAACYKAVKKLRKFLEAFPDKHYKKIYAMVDQLSVPAERKQALLNEYIKIASSSSNTADIRGILKPPGNESNRHKRRMISLPVEEAKTEKNSVNGDEPKTGSSNSSSSSSSSSNPSRLHTPKKMPKLSASNEDNSTKVKPPGL